MRKLHLFFLISTAICALPIAHAQDNPSAPIAATNSRESFRHEIEENIDKLRKRDDETKVELNQLAAAESSPQKDFDPYNYINQLKETVKPFMLKKVVLEDVHSIEDKLLNPAYSAYLNQDITAEDILQICEKIQAIYIEHGYLLTNSYAPLASNFKDGVLRIKINNAKFRKVHLLGFGETADLIKSYQEKIVNTYPVTKATIVRYKKLIERMPGYQVQMFRIIPVPGAHAANSPDGYADLVVVGTKKSNKVRLKAGNDISKIYGDYKASATVDMYSPFKKGEEIKLYYVTSNRHKVMKNFGINYKMPINSNGTVISVSGHYDRNNPTLLPSNRMTPSTKNNHNYNVSLELSHPFILNNKLDVTGAVGFEYADSLIYRGQVKHIHNQERLFNSSLQVEYKDNLDAINSAKITWFKSLPSSKYRRYRESDHAIVGKQNNNYNYWNYYAYRWQPLVTNLYGLVSVYGQQSKFHLPSSQHQSLGGQGFIRGYDDNISASKGNAVSTELHYFVPINHSYLKWLELITFYDHGKLLPVGNYEKKVLAQNSKLASYGYAVKAAINGSVKVNLQVGYPLNKTLNQDKKPPKQTIISLEHTVEW